MSNAEEAIEQNERDSLRITQAPPWMPALRADLALRAKGDGFRNDSRLHAQEQAHEAQQVEACLQKNRKQ